MGTGLAYGEEDDALLLNAFLSAMSLNNEHSDELAEWLDVDYPNYDIQIIIPIRIWFREQFIENTLVNYLNYNLNLENNMDIFVESDNFNSLRVERYYGEKMHFSLNQEWIYRQKQSFKGLIPLEIIKD